MKNKLNDTFLNQLTENMLKNRHVKGAVFCVENQEGSLEYLGATGELKPDDLYFIASVTKLYITAMIIMLRNEKKLSFSDNIIRYFPESFLNGMHVIDGKDYTNEITIEHLISNASGLPDYFYYVKSKENAADGMKQGKDVAWTLEMVVERVKTLKPKFKPGQKGKVNYSDTNYQLLGAIIEKITGLWIGDAFDTHLFKPLKLKDTYAFKDNNDTKVIPFYHKKEVFFAPKYMASVTAEGGIVSTAKEVMVFTKAFYNGFFFPVETLEELKQNWRKIWFPGQFYFGVGLEKLWVPRIFSPFKPIKDILGFWGQTGAFSFYNPDTGLYFTGTVNQANGLGHGAAFKAILKCIKAAKS